MYRLRFQSRALPVFVLWVWFVVSPSRRLVIEPTVLHDQLVSPKPVNGYSLFMALGREIPSTGELVKVVFNRRFH